MDENPTSRATFWYQFHGDEIEIGQFKSAHKIHSRLLIRLMIIYRWVSRIEHIGWRCYVGSIGLSSSFNSIYRPLFQCATFLATPAHTDPIWSLSATTCPHSDLIFSKNRDEQKFSYRPFDSPFQELQSPTIDRSKKVWPPVKKQLILLPIYHFCLFFDKFPHEHQPTCFKIKN